VNAIQPAAENHIRATITLNESVRQAAARFQPVAQQYGVLINLVLSQKPIQILASPFFITRVLEGLLVHSLRYGSASGQRTFRMESTSGGQVQIQLIDKEAPVDEKQLSHLFEKNFRPAAAPSRFVGVGISLPLAQEIITAHAGKIWAAGKPGEGITYHITLPLTRG
jgi:signal transduction histidine kinase